MALLEQTALVLFGQPAKSLHVSRSRAIQEFGGICGFRAIGRNDHLSINPLEV